MQNKLKKMLLRMLPKHIKNIWRTKWLKKHKTTHLLMLLDKQKLKKYGKHVMMHYKHVKMLVTIS